MSRWDRILLALLAAHLIWGVARIPGKVYGKRLDRIADHQQRGAPAFHLDNRHRKGAEAVRFVLDNTPEDCVVLWSGQHKGALEFVPPLIAPRLLVDARACPPQAGRYLGRPLARGTLADGSEGTLLLRATEHEVRLELR